MVEYDALVRDAFARRAYDDARVLAQDWVSAAPGHGLALRALGMACVSCGDLRGAVSSYERACACPDAPARWVHELAMLLAADGRWREVTGVLRPRTAELDDEGVRLLCAVSVRAGESVATLEACRRAGRVPRAPDALLEYGRVCLEAEAWHEAAEALSGCDDLGPANVDRTTALARLFQKTGRSADALQAWDQVVAAHPDEGSLRLRHAVALAEAARPAEARTARLAAEACHLEPRHRDMAVYLRLFDEQEDGASIRAASEAASPATTSVQAALPAALRPWGRPRRIGFIGAEFVTPPARHFLDPWLTALGRSGQTLHFYASSARESGRRPMYLQDGDVWRDVSALSDDALYDTLIRDDLDVLVDLVGRFPGHRLAVLARCPAPRQAVFPNFPSTLGCEAIDVILSDRWTSPPGCDDEYTERVCRLAGGYLAYAPPGAPPVTALPALAGHVTFGLLQRGPKLTDSTWDGVAEVLRAVPGARLLVHNSDCELDDAGSALVAHLRGCLAARDVDPERLDCVGRLAIADHLDLLGRVDVALDCYPYGGQTTTAECLWMGVPVVTRSGPSHVSRVSAGLIARLGLDDLVATSPRGFVGAAVRLAGDLAYLRTLRATLRDRTIACGLTDGVRLAREMADALADAETWRWSVADADAGAGTSRR